MRRLPCDLRSSASSRPAPRPPRHRARSHAAESFRRRKARRCPGSWGQRRRSATGDRGAPEGELRGPIEELMQAAGSELAKAVVCKGESKWKGRLGKPDYAVLTDGALTGYVELKSPGHGANPNTYKGHNRDQWKRFKSLPN